MALQTDVVALMKTVDSTKERFSIVARERIAAGSIYYFKDIDSCGRTRGAVHTLQLGTGFPD